MTKYYWPEWRVYLLARLKYQPEMFVGKKFRISALFNNKSFISSSGYIVSHLVSLHPKVIKFGSLYLDQLSALREALVDSQLSIMSGETALSAGRKALASRLREIERKAIANFMGKNISLDDWQRLASSAPKYLYDNLTIEVISVDEQLVKQELDGYLTDFQTCDLTVASGSEPYSYEKQKLLLKEAYDRKLPSFGRKQRLTIKDIWQRDGTEHLGKFWELILSMEQAMDLSLLDFGYETSPLTSSEVIAGTGYTQHATPLAFARIELLTARTEKTITDEPELPLECLDDGGFKYQGVRLKEISTDTQPGKMLKLLSDSVGELVKNEKICTEVGTADARNNGFVLRNLKALLKKNKLVIKVERRRLKGYILLTVEQIQPSS